MRAGRGGRQEARACALADARARRPVAAARRLRAADVQGGRRRRDSARGRSATEVDEVGGRTRKWVGAGASARGSELASPSRRGSPGFPVMGLWGRLPGQPGWEGSRASAVPADPGLGQGSLLAVVARAHPSPCAPPRAALLCPVGFGRSVSEEPCRARPGKAR